MPEIIEIEYYRRWADRLVGAQVVEVSPFDPSYLAAGCVISPEEFVADLTGTTLLATRRHGKLLILEFEGGPSLGCRFGMTGRLMIDSAGPIDRLEYGPVGDHVEWHRFGLRFDDGRHLLMSDARRLGSVDPVADVSRLGPDAWTVSGEGLERVLAGRVALKARLLDQSRLAGLGNLLCDEVCSRAGVDPRTPAGSLTGEAGRLAETIREVIDDLDAAGGSHLGSFRGERHPDGRCPLDGEQLVRCRVGGRTTYLCPAHQGSTN